MSTPSSVPQLLAEFAALPLEFWGFHIYSGSQNLRPEILVESQQKTAALAIELARHAPAPVRMLNLGGGFGIPYFPGEQPLDLAPIGSNLRDAGPGDQGRAARRRRSRSNSGATWSASRASTSAASSTRRSRAATCSWSRMAGCTTTWPPRATSAR